MYKFFSGNTNNLQSCTLSIEQRTHLLVIEQKSDGEKWGRYIRLTGQQVERIKAMFFKGDFSSTTRPANSFRLNNGVYTMVCREDNQVLRFRLEDMHHIYQYYERHKDHIARFDVQFRGRH